MSINAQHDILDLEADVEDQRIRQKQGLLASWLRGLTTVLDIAPSAQEIWKASQKAFRDLTTAKILPPQ